jgi:hypothetical protein
MTIHPAIPVAKSRRKRRISLIWLIPALAFIASALLAYRAIVSEGPAITIRFAQGHGIKVDDAIRYRGIRIGRVAKVRLTPDGGAVEITARLDPPARGMAREGSRFWIVRPRVGLGGISGLDTVIGANYINLRPGDGPFTDRFAGLENPPYPAVIEPGSLTVTVSASEKGRLQPGAPISYREMAVGVVSTVSLSRDAGSVTAEVYIAPDYVDLIRHRTRFWRASGARLSAGFTGFDFQLDSVRGLIDGGVNISVPADAGPAVSPGHRFRLHDRPEPEWLAWHPALNLDGRAGGTPAGDLPRPVRVTVIREKRLLGWDRKIRRHGWVLPVPGGLLGPEDLLASAEADKPARLRFPETDRRIDLSSVPECHGTGLVYLPFAHSFPVWPAERRRRVTEPEDTVIVGNLRHPTRFISADRYTENGDHWAVDPALSFSDDWHGAPVVSDADGAMIGMVLKEGDAMRVALFHADTCD